MNAAVLLVAERRPDEAEPLVLEAIEFRKTAPAGGRDGLAQLLEQIRAMKKVDDCWFRARFEGTTRTAVNG